MPPIFENLLFLDQRADPGRPAWNMAMDEALLRHAPGPVLRVYAWDQPAVSFGYFIQKEEAAAAAARGTTLVRRWTGGGIVLHGTDLTWSLTVPAAETFFQTKPAQSYAVLHAACAAVLQESGLPVVQVAADSPAPDRGLCFIQPAPGDLLLSGQKIAGAGQRRTRQGLLHQASMSGFPFPALFPEQLAAVFSRNVTPLKPDAGLVACAHELEASRYAAREWLDRI